MKTYNEKELVKFEGNWHSIVKESLQNKVPIASSREIVSLRNKLPYEHDIWRYGGWTKEQPIYAPKNQGILVMNSMLLKPELAEKVVEASRNNKYLELSKSQYEKFLRTAEKEEKSKKEERSVLILPSRNNFEIFPKNNYGFAENLFGKENAEKYFKEKGINSITFYTISPDYVDEQNNPITTELWFRDLDGRSGLGGVRYLGYDDFRAFGVREVSAEGTQKILLPSKQKEIKDYVNILEGIKDGKIPNSKVEKVIKGLERLISKKP